MLLIISSIMIIAYTVYFCIHTAAKKQYVSSTSGKCISMLLGMVSSTMIGLIIALLFPGELAYTTVLSIVVSCFVAYFVGKLFGLSGIIEAIAASFMGAMMGAMLGEMVPQNHEAFMMIAMDIIYLASVISMMLMVNKEAVKEKRIKVTQVAPLLLSLVLSLSVIGIVAILEVNVHDKQTNPEISQGHHH